MYDDFEDDEQTITSPYKGLCRRNGGGVKINCSACSNYSPENHSRPLFTGTGQDNDCCNGFMGYYDHPHVWSNCSVRFFQESYIIGHWNNCMNYGKFWRYLRIGNIGLNQSYQDYYCKTSQNITLPLITEPRQLYDTVVEVANNISTTTETLDDKPSIKQKGIYMRSNMVRYETLFCTNAKGIAFTNISYFQI